MGGLKKFFHNIGPINKIHMQNVSVHYDNLSVAAAGASSLLNLTHSRSSISSSLPLEAFRHQFRPSQFLDSTTCNNFSDAHNCIGSTHNHNTAVSMGKEHIGKSKAAYARAGSSNGEVMVLRRLLRISFLGSQVVLTLRIRTSAISVFFGSTLSSHRLNSGLCFALFQGMPPQL